MAQGLVCGGGSYTSRQTPGVPFSLGMTDLVLGEGEELGSRTLPELSSIPANTGAQVGTARKLLGAQDAGPQWL